jgi:uncharacterized protein DUF3604
MFVVWVVKDPTSGNLDRIQIIKGWTKNGQRFEKISTLPGLASASLTSGRAGFPRFQSTVDIQKATAPTPWVRWNRFGLPGVFSATTQPAARSVAGLHLHTYV